MKTILFDEEKYFTQKEYFGLRINQLLIDQPGLQLVTDACLSHGRSRTSEQDEASFERRRREPLGRSGACSPRPPSPPRNV